MKMYFYATQPHYFDHQVPIWEALGEDAGTFYTGRLAYPRAKAKGVDTVLLDGGVPPGGDGPLLVASTGDLSLVLHANKQRKYVLMEHGLGIVYPGHASYAGGRGDRTRASLTLAPNEHVYWLTHNAIPEMRQYIIGTPKLDRWSGRFFNYRELPERPTVAITFHWNGDGVAPEAGSAFGHFQKVLPQLAKERAFKLVGHAHPRVADKLKSYYKSIGMEYWADPDRVMDEADLLVADNTSFMYEWLVTGKQLVILNSPKYRKDVDFGIRFWKYTDVGEQVDNPAGLYMAICKGLWGSVRGAAYFYERKRAVEDLFPYLGESARGAATILKEYMNELQSI